jgi:hypothetical protein
LLYDCIEDLAFEWSEDDCLVLDWIDDKALTSLNNSRSNIDDCCDCNDKSILSCTSSFNFCVELLADCVKELWTEVARMQEDLVF